MTVSQDDMLAIVGEMQQAIDRSCFEGEAYTDDAEPFALKVILFDEILDEPGARGRYPFYQSKPWLTEKAKEFVSSHVDGVLDSWNEGECLRECFAEPVNMGADGDSCQLLVIYRIA